MNYLQLSNSLIRIKDVLRYLHKRNVITFFLLFLNIYLGFCFLFVVTFAEKYKYLHLCFMYFYSHVAASELIHSAFKFNMKNKYD